MNRLVLVTGGTGKTGRRLVAQLRKKGLACRVAARGTASNDGACSFDWTDRDSWERALEDVSAAYLVAPALEGDPAPVMVDFVRRALERGVSRFVLLSASLLPAAGPAMGQVHLWLQENAPEWTVLRPSWFMQNFSEGQHLASIRAHDRIYSAAQDGRVPFVSADDIAASAMIALTGESPLNSDFVLTGSSPITYDEAAECISEAVGRTISHHRLSPDELAGRYRSLGLGPIHARTLAAMDAAVAAGAEDRVTSCVENLTGQPPIAFGAFVEANSVKWSAAG
jgi:ergot alkaloid biosynthesis protein